MIQEILKEFDDLYKPEIGSGGIEFDRYKRKRNWFSQKLEEVYNAGIDDAVKAFPETHEEDCHCDGSGKDLNGYCDCGFSFNDALEQAKQNILNLKK